MHTEHHIDSFDLPSFFKLHDLNMDGLWDVNEIKAVYGLHNEKAKAAVGQPGDKNSDGKLKGMDADMMIMRVLESWTPTRMVRLVPDAQGPSMLLC